jgi:tetratricopeptide (TPR) repeat protein
VNAGRSWLEFGLVGFLIGACLSLCLTGGLLVNRIVTRPIALAATQAAATRVQELVLPNRTPAPTSVSHIQAQATPTSLADAWFDQADRLFAEGEPQQVLDLLQPKLGLFTDKQDRADAYYYLGQAEAQLGHYQLAAAQFANLQELQPTGEHLYVLAVAYDLGGDLEHALANYEALLNWNGYVPDDYYRSATQRVQDLRRIIGTPTPVSR